MKLNPAKEVMHRIKLAALYLKEAREAYKGGNYRLSVASSQLSVENSAKAVISYFRVPSWSHDPSHELLELLENLPPDVRDVGEKLARFSAKLAPEHARSTYGEPETGKTPWDIYSEEDAREALKMAEQSLEYARRILKSLGMEPRST